MIVHESRDSWQLVQQQHHGKLAGQIAAAWGNDHFSAPRRESLVTAAERHDDGWAVWEQWPRLDDQGQPLRFFDVLIPSHLAFYRAAIVDIASVDPYAGLLIAMHGAGIYRERYGTQPGLRNNGAERYPDEVEGFVREMEESYPRRMEEAGVSDEERWVDYRLLQTFDRLALYFSGLPPLEQDQALTIGHVPVDYEGGEAELTLTPLAPFEHAPTRVRIEPFPFRDSPASFSLERRVLAKDGWDEAGYRDAVRATPSEHIELVAES
jgi:hypothetical protein